jgi:RHS repeat-associated protein
MRVVTQTEPINQAAIITVEVPMLSRSLTFRTDWTATRRAAYRWTLHDLDPGSTIGIEVAGRTESAIADESGTAVFDWDGLDAEGDRPGPCIAVATVGGEQRRARLGRWDPVTIGLGGLMLSGHDYLDPTGRRVYTATGRLKGNIALTHTDDGYETTHSNGRYRIRFDNAGFLTEVVDNASGATIATYRRDEHGLALVTSGRMTIDISRSDGLISVVRNGWLLRIETDTDGRATSMVDPSDRGVRFEYDPAGRLGTLIDASGFRYRYDYDDAGRLVGITNPGQGRVDLVRKSTEHGHRVTLVTAEGRESFYQVERMPDGTKVRTSQCCGGQPTVTRFEADTVEVDEPDGTKVVSRRGAGQRQVILPSGVTYTRTSNIGGVAVNGRRYESTRDTSRLASKTPLGREFKVEETEDGVRITWPDRVIEMVKDSRGRVTRIVDGETVLDVEHDHYDRASSFIWSDGSTFRFDYDGSGWLTAQHFSGERVVRLTRDGGGLVTAVRPPGSEETRFQLDAPGRIASVQFPSGPDGEDRVDFDYDDDGLVVSRRVAGLPPVIYTRGAGGEVRAIASGESAATLEHENGRLVKAATSEGQSTLVRYDGRLVAEVSSEGRVSGSVAYEHDEGFRLSKISSGHLSATIEYDNDGLPSRVGEATIERDAAGRVVSVTAGVVQQTYEYSTSRRPIRMTVRANDTDVWSVGYERDAAGRIVTLIDSLLPGPVHFGYDEAHRLVHATGAADVTVSYDANGNPTSVNRNGQAMQSTIDPGDRLRTLGSTRLSYGPGGVVAAIGAEQITRDAAGRIVQVSQDGGAVRFHRDVFGFIVAVDREGEDGSRFINGLHGRPEVVIGSEGSPELLLVGASASNTPLVAVASDRTLFLASDHLGSVRLVIDVASGEVLERRSYDAWGNLIGHEGSSPVPYGFGGGVDDPSTGLVHFPVRSYSPQLMRWLSRDPRLFLGGSTNLYAYSNNDPVNHRDPTGRTVEVCRTATDFMPESIFPGEEHWWLRTDDAEAGMTLDPTTVHEVDPSVVVGDDTGHGAQPGSQCDPVDNVDEDCVNRHLQTNKVSASGTRYGDWLGFYGFSNTCQQFVDQVLSECSSDYGVNGNYQIETRNPGAYDHWYNPDVNVAPYSPVGHSLDPEPAYTPADGDYTPDDSGELWQ